MARDRARRYHVFRLFFLLIFLGLSVPLQVLTLELEFFNFCHENLHAKVHVVLQTVLVTGCFVNHVFV